MPTKKTSRAQARKTTKAKPATGRTFVNIILDESGSMATILNETVQGVNSYLEGLKATPKVYVTLTKFNTRTNVLYAMEPIKKAPALNDKNYSPNGFTALCDAIGVCVKAMGKEVKDKDRVLNVIVTDGAENSSKEWNQSQVKTLITEHEGKGNWTFTFLAANIDVRQFAQATGMNVGNTMSYQATSAGTRRAFENLQSATFAYSASADRSTKSFYAPAEPEVKKVTLGPKRRVIP